MPADLGTCQHCHQPVRWTITAARKRQALNPEPDNEGNVVAYRDGLGTWRSRVPSADLPQASHERRYMPHAATCLQQPRTVTQSRLPDGVVSLAARRRQRRAGGRR